MWGTALRGGALSNHGVLEALNMERRLGVRRMLMRRNPLRAQLNFVPAAFTTYGGWGQKIYAKLELEYEQRKKHEKEEGRSGWAAFRWKRDILERMSIAIAKGNWALLDAHTPAPRV